MPLKRSKICLFFCGGSTLIGRKGQSIEVHTRADIKPWLAEVPELSILADLESVFVFGGESETVPPEIWSFLAKEIKKRYSSFDGFVITHDFDSIVYTGAALSFMLRNLGKPVVLTGSQDTVETPAKASQKIFDQFRQYGIRANLVNAAQVATMDLAEVGVIYGNVLLRATQARRLPSKAIDLTESPGSTLGKADFGVKLLEDRQLRRKTALIVRSEIEKNVFSLQLHPGLDFRGNLELLPKNLKSVILRATDIALSDSDYKFLNDFAVQRKLPLFIVPEADTRLPKLGYLIQVPPMLQEVALVKVMWALGQTKSIAQLRELMNENQANEFLISPPKE